MRLVLQNHAVSLRCERCLPNVIELHRDCAHVLEQLDDGSPTLTLIVVDGDNQKVYSLDERQQALLATEGWPTILAEIDEFERNQPPGD